MSGGSRIQPLGEHAGGWVCRAFLELELAAGLGKGKKEVRHGGKGVLGWVGLVEWWTAGMVVAGGW